jgi:hypothetical protein
MRVEVNLTKIVLELSLGKLVAMIRVQLPQRLQAHSMLLLPNTGNEISRLSESQSRRRGRQPHLDAFVLVLSSLNSLP